MSDEKNSVASTEARARELDALLDEIIPPRGERGLPGAGELGLAAAIQQSAANDPALRDVLERGLSRLAEAARRVGAERFSELAAGDRLQLLNELAETEPELIQGLLAPTYAAYYQRPEVVRAIGIESWPPHPQGYVVETGDLSLLDPVRQRGEFYRRV